MARKAAITQLKRRHARRLLQLTGVHGVGVERGDDDDDYVLVVHVDEVDSSTREAVTQAVGTDAVRIVPAAGSRSSDARPLVIAPLSEA